MDTGVGFRCSYEQHDTHLVVRYVIDNHRGGDVAALNRIRSSTIDGSFDVSPRNAFIHLEGTTLHVSKVALAAQHPIVPLATRIPPGTSIEESFSIPVPVRVSHPLERRRLKGQVIASRACSASRLVVSIGVVPVTRAEQLVATQPADPEALSVFPDDYWALDHQEIISQELVLQRPVAALDYVAFPWP